GDYVCSSQANIFGVATWPNPASARLPGEGRMALHRGHSAPEQGPSGSAIWLLCADRRGRPLSGVAQSSDERAGSSMRSVADMSWDQAIAMEEFAEPMCFTTHAHREAVAEMLGREVVASSQSGKSRTEWPPAPRPRRDAAGAATSDGVGQL